MAKWSMISMSALTKYMYLPAKLFVLRNCMHCIMSTDYTVYTVFNNLKKWYALCNLPFTSIKSQY